MQESYHLRGKKLHVESIFEEATQKVKLLHPDARAQGNLFHWIWTVEEEIVAEAWPAKGKPGWSLKVRHLER